MPVEYPLLFKFCSVLAGSRLQTATNGHAPMGAGEIRVVGISTLMDRWRAWRQMMSNDVRFVRPDHC